ncbi:MAG TPA: helix-turn-helix domain-containing protein [Parapedobacter sp.]|uniref:helix-turn-helix domain-containing protein n=1 Tax=Parapedobacter sp. TaxID=1958893 RepID=UPI002B7731AE|nr:helix-turn-helix domain-containing protein [Parapedobacter sp.]HWK59262.1 helix-turn-helix domain-containing protein [Parapedobacter sp.]
MKHTNTRENLQLYLATESQLKSVVMECVKEALQGAATTQIGHDAQPEIIDTKTLLTRLDLSEPTVIRYRQKGVIPFLQVGSAIRYDYQKVLEALEKRKGGKK